MLIDRVEFVQIPEGISALGKLNALNPIAGSCHDSGVDEIDEREFFLGNLLGFVVDLFALSFVHFLRSFDIEIVNFLLPIGDDPTIQLR